jgi:CIC family chloride channel protein
VLAGVVATAVGRLAFGAEAFLTLPPFTLVSGWEYPLYALLGIAAAAVGVAFIRVLYGMEDAADRVWRGPAWLRPACGGILLGLVLLALPQMYGVGYPVLEGAIHGRYVVWALLAFLVGKIAATSLTMAIGGSGGVFAPSLFIGAMLGTAFGIGAHDLLPGARRERALGKVAGDDTIYTLKLRRRGRGIANSLYAVSGGGEPS